MSKKAEDPKSQGRLSYWDVRDVPFSRLSFFSVKIPELVFLHGGGGDFAPLPLKFGTKTIERLAQLASQ